MSEILVNKLTGTSTAGSILVTGEGNSTTTNLQQGLIKAFAQQDDGTSLNESFNVSALIDNGTGRYEVTLTNVFTNDNFSSMVCASSSTGNCSIDSSHQGSNQMSSRVYRTDTGAYLDSTNCNYYGVGDLA
jgi:hypothetical protein